MALTRLGGSRRGRRRARELGSWLAEEERRDRFGREAVALLELAGASANAWAPALTAGLQARDAGRLGEAGRLLDLAAGSAAPPAVRVAALRARAEVARLAGDYARAVANHEQLECELAGECMERGQDLVGWGRSLWGLRRPREASARLLEGIAMLQPLLPEPVAAREVARGLATLRRIADVLPGVALPPHRPEDFAGRGTPRDRYVIAASLGVLAAECGDLDAAVVHHREAVDRARSAHLHSAVVTALYDLGRIERRRGDREAARAHLSECERLAAALGRNPMLARVHNELGELYRGIGASESAVHHYQEAASLQSLVAGPAPRLAVLNLARMHAESGRGDLGREALVALEADEELADWIRGPLSLTVALCEAGQDDASAQAHLRQGLATLSASHEARLGAIEILDLLAERWESSDEEAAAREARSAARVLAAALDRA